MAAISGIEGLGVSYTPQRESHRDRAPVDYGAAVSHRDEVRENHRVDPTALVEKERQRRAIRRDDAAEQDRARRERRRDAADHAQEQRERRRVDVKV